MRKLKYILVILSMLFIFNFIKTFFTKEDNVPRVEINEELVFQNDNENKEKLDINNVMIDEILKIGLSIKEAYKIIEYRDFVGYIDTVDNLVRIKGINRNNIDKYKKIFLVEDTEEKEYVKHNINELSEDELFMLGFSKDNVRYILEIRNNKEIRSDLELKGKVNMNVVNKHIKF
ncbi:helix-hairpin-helix domain-containing protein [Streptobacillus felis]|uniref:helix-hairpin-helix domain-containing protein n=1 Tax=Streptobacillus felis TaxID=1384509 RepID=UPI00083733D1|nr:helix-hairpin-helix domain-containing protein [Streptobacillus felis]